MSDRKEPAMSPIDVRAKWVEPQTVAGVRCFVKDPHEVLTTIGELREKAGPAASGPPVCLFLGHEPEKGFQVEIGLPVAKDATIEGAEIKELAGDHVLWATHTGPYTKADGAQGLRETAERMWAFIAERNLLAGDNPTRYVYLEGPETHGNRTERYVTEIQISYHFPAWIESLERGLKERTDEATSAAVTAGADEVRHDFDSGKLRAWVLGALDRLDGSVPSERTRACVLNGCAHRYPKAQLLRMKAAYEEEGDVLRFIDRLNRDDDLFPSRIFWREGEPRHVVYTEKLVPPWNREAYDRATDPVEKRYYGCFCSLVKEVIRTGEELSPSFCNCSAGWYVQMWETILGRSPIRVDLVESILRGDDRCRFAIHLPEDLFS
jgi:effector-binding domain-containing protein